MKQIATRLSEEEYNKLLERSTKLSLEQNKVITISSYLRLIVKEHINGNEPPEIPNIVESKESTENIEAKPLGFSDIDMNFS